MMTFSVDESGVRGDGAGGKAEGVERDHALAGVMNTVIVAARRGWRARLLLQ